MNGKGRFRKIAAMVTAAVMAVTGVSAAGGTGLSTPGAAALAPSENIYESFLGFDSSFAVLPEAYYSNCNVNLWSGNLALQYTLPYGNLYGRMPMKLTYNSQADCDMGFGKNVVMYYWAKLEFAGENTVRLMNGTGTVDTFTKNAATGRFEKDDWYVEAEPGGGYHAVARGGEYYFGAEGEVTRLHVSNSYVWVNYNPMGYVESVSDQNDLTYQFEYEPYESDGQLYIRCTTITCNYPFALEYDEQNRLVGGGYAYEPYERDFSYTYGENGLLSEYSIYGDVGVPVQYQTVGGYQKVTNFNGTQIVYGKNTTIAIGPDGAVTTWQFDDNGNLLSKA